MMSTVISARSDDAQTKVGCILVGADNNLLGCGYNGYVRGFDGNAIPNVRPEKYEFFIHAEINAILNCGRKGVPLLGAKAYISGKPCTNCYQSMLQAGINEIVYTDYSAVNKICNDERVPGILNYLSDCRYRFIPFSKVLEQFYGVYNEQAKENEGC